MSYRGPDDQRIQQQMRALQGIMAETATWRQWASAGTGSGSAYLAGSGANYYRDETISALFAVPRARETFFHEDQLPGGTVLYGNVIASTFRALGSEDQIVWRDTPYSVEGESIPVRIGGRLWYRTMLRRGEG